MLHALSTARIGGQLFGIPFEAVSDILGPQRVTPLPLAPAVIAGIIVLRGETVLALDTRARLGLPPQDQPSAHTIVVNVGGQRCALQVDSLGEIAYVDPTDWETPPHNLDNNWKTVSQAVVTLDDELLIVMDVPSLLGNILDLESLAA